jgi:hypothetical protein
MATQKQRVLASLRNAGGRGITQVDWLGVSPDGGSPILRLPARISELRSDGYTIRNAGLRDSCRVYVLEGEAARGVDRPAEPAEEPSEEPAPLFEVEAPAPDPAELPAIYREAA